MIGRIDEAERSLKEIIYKQSQLKLSLNEGKTQFKNMVGSFILQLSHMAEHTGNYQGKIEACAKRIREIEDIGKLNDLGVHNATDIARIARRRTRIGTPKCLAASGRPISKVSLMVSHPD